MSDKERIINTILGWDITDYGMEDFNRIGSVLFTIRNGVMNALGIGTPYAEKLLPTMDVQRLLLHFHYSKCEDIINQMTVTCFIACRCSPRTPTNRSAICPKQPRIRSICWERMGRAWHGRTSPWAGSV